MENIYIRMDFRKGPSTQQHRLCRCLSEFYQPINKWLAYLLLFLEILKEEEDLVVNVWYSVKMK